MQDLVLLMNNDVAGCRVSWVYSEIVVPLRIFWWMAGKCTRFAVFFFKGHKKNIKLS